MSNFTFNGIKKSYINIARGWSMPAWAPIIRSSMMIPGRPGSLTTSKETGERIFSIPIIVLAQSFEEKELFVEDMASWLLQEKPGPLVFDKYPNRTLYAEIEGTIEFDEMWKSGEGVLNIYCSDPYKYAPSESTNFANGSSTIVNSGTVDASPIFEATVLEDITYLDVFNDQGYMRIGQPIEIGQTAVEKDQRMLWDQMNNLTGWTSAGTVDGGVVAGAFSTNGYDFLATYGTGSSWHGPAVKKSVPNAPLTDFKLEFMIKFPTVSGNYGRIECYLLDDQSQVVGKIAMKKVGGGSTGNRVEIRLGDTITNHFLVNYAGDNGRAWNDFDGILRLTRVGNEWEAYIAMIDSSTGKHHTRHTARFKDVSNLFGKNLSQVQIHMAQNGTLPVPALKISDLKVFRINEVPNTSPYIIAKAGDIIKFDHKKSEITINGEDKKDLKDFGASFFKLSKGVNTVLIEPKDKVTATMTIEEAYR